MLDARAFDYAKLLRDPCGAALVNPVYPGGDAGFLFRAESFFTVGTGTATAGVVHWTPGYVNNNLTELLYMDTSTASTNNAMTISGASPGRGFLQDTARAVRCIGACMKVTYAGSESSRAGRVHYGHTSSGMLDNGNVVTADSVAQTLMHYSRTPAETFEILWYPGVGDFEFNDPQEPAGTLMRDRKTSLTVAFAGLPAGAGLTIHMTAIYEWRPAIGQGIGHNALGKTRSANSFDDVMDYLLNAGETFVRHAGNMAGSIMGAAAVSQMSRVFGLMPAQQSTRRIDFR